MAEARSSRSLRELTRALFSRLLGILLVLILVVAAALAATFLSRWEYRSRALLYVRPLAPAAGAEAAAPLRDRLSLFVGTQQELICSDAVVAAALMKMDGRAPDGEPAPQGKERWYKPETLERYAAENARRIAACLRRVRAETPGRPDATFTQTLSVSVDWPEQSRPRAPWGRRRHESRRAAAQAAQRFARYLIGAYLARRAELEKTHADSSRAHLEDEADALARGQLDAAERELTEILDEIRKLNADPVLVEDMLRGTGEARRQGLSTRLQADIDLRKARLRKLEALEKALGEQFAKGDTVRIVVHPELLAADASLRRLLDGVAALRMELHGLRQRFTDEYPTVKQTRAELAANVADLKQQLKLLLAGMQAAAKAELAHFETEMSKQQDILAAVAARIPEYRRRKALLDSARKAYGRWKADAVAAERAARLATRQVEVWLAGGPSRPDPDAPHRPILWLNLLVGSAAAVILSLIYAFLCEHYDHSVKGMDDVERHVGLDVLASVPKFRRRMIRPR